MQKLVRCCSAFAAHGVSETGVSHTRLCKHAIRASDMPNSWPHRFDTTRRARGVYSLFRTHCNNNGKLAIAAAFDFDTLRACDNRMTTKHSFYLVYVQTRACMRVCMYKRMDA